jgi:hypothetical protein
MIALQIGCTAIILLYLVLRLRHEPARRTFALRFAVLVLSSWIAENSCIRLYGFYAYDPEWFGFVDQVPILIVLIWPVVIHSALDLVRHRGVGRPAAVAISGALVVLTDAALIEPIAVKAGLWRWFEPGIFEVPPIGILGWSAFSAIAIGVLASRRHILWMLLLAPIGTHLFLLGAWWGLFRHVNGPIDATTASWVALGAAALVTGWLLRQPATRFAPPSTMLLRAPGAGFFFVLLVIHATDDPSLVRWAVAFAIPWLVAVARSALGQSRRSGRLPVSSA